ncbi:MAG: M18 family aminopeptidase [Clostridia bacterium]|nr:M18 family aminopeptidase [Clostridia bacterium]
MKKSVQNFIRFISASPSAFHAVQSLCDMLDAKGFARLDEHKPFAVVPGGKYYVTRNRSSVIAFAIPEGGLSHFQIAASHSDSPTFKLKPFSEEVVCSKYLRLNVERYGGMIMSTWFDRPLSIAGRAVVREGGRLVTRLVDLGRDAVLIPNMPIHFNREVNDGYKYNAQVDLLPLFGGADAKGALAAQVAEACGAQAQDIVGYDLFLYNRMPGSVWGAQNEFFSCPRIDDLECAYASAEAFLAAVPQGHVNVLAVFDNEEVGSGTKQGADSSFLADVLSRACAALGMDESAQRAAFSASFMVSADNAHAVHPNHPEKYDADNRTFMNGGVVIKHNANQKYTTDAVSCAIFSQICSAAGVPVQQFSNRSDVLGGSTLGNIANAHLSMNTVDIGLAQLAMHSAYETAGCEDLDHMIRALTAFYNAQIETCADGEYLLG